MSMWKLEPPGPDSQWLAILTGPGGLRLIAQHTDDDQWAIEALGGVVFVLNLMWESAPVQGGLRALAKRREMARIEFPDRRKV